MSCSSLNHPDYCDCPQEVYDSYNKPATQVVVSSSDDESDASSSARDKSLALCSDPAFIRLARKGRFSSIIKRFSLANVEHSNRVWKEMVMIRVLDLSVDKVRRHRVKEEIALSNMKKAFNMK